MNSVFTVQRCSSRAVANLFSMFIYLIGAVFEFEFHFLILCYCSIYANYYVYDLSKFI